MLIRIVVPTASATAPRSWLAMPNIGQIVLMSARPDEVAPAEHDDRRGGDRGRHRVGARERLVDAAAELLQEEPADARARIDGRQDEERLEHDREVVPVGHQPAHARQPAEDVGHADGEGHRAARRGRRRFRRPAPADPARLTVDSPSVWKTAGDVLMA